MVTRIRLATAAFAGVFDWPRQGDWRARTLDRRMARTSSAGIIAPRALLHRSDVAAQGYLNNSGLGSAMKPSRFGIITFGMLAASSTADLSMIFPSAKM